MDCLQLQNVCNDGVFGMWIFENCTKCNQACKDVFRHVCIYIYICIVKQMRGLLKSLLISWDPLVFGTLSTVVNWAIEKFESFHC